jgi:anti-anti-sigma factor
MQHGPLNIDVTRAPDGVVVVACAGELDVAGVAPFVDAVRRELQAGARRLCIDLDELGLLDSAGIAALVNVRRYTIRGLGRLVLVCREGGQVERMLVQAGLEPYFEVERTRAQAVRSLAPEARLDSDACLPSKRSKRP